MALATSDRALEVLSALVPGTPLAFDAGGVAQLTVQDALVLNLQRLDATHIRAITYLDGIAAAMTARFLLNALTENHRPAPRDFARFGLHPDIGILAVEETLDVSIMTPETFEARLLGFVKTVAYWTANADNLFDDPNMLEAQVHSTGSGMSDEEFRSLQEFDEGAGTVMVKL